MATQDQQLLVDPAPPATDSAPEHSLRSDATPSQLLVLKFVFLTPLNCSLPIALVLIFVGVGASVAMGILLALFGKESGQLGVSFKLQDQVLFDATIQKIAIYIVIMVFVYGLATFCMKQIGLMKRMYLNRTLHSEYLKNKCFYVLNVFHSNHCDSIDSRLTSDIETMTSELFSIVQTVVFQLTAFIYSMVLLSNDNVALIALLCLCLFSVIMFGIIQYFLKKTSSCVSQLKKEEGTFIFQHTRIKKNCESIAFYSGQFLELDKIKLIFDAVLRSYRMVVKSQTILDFLGIVYNNGVASFVIWIGYFSYLQSNPSKSPEDNARLTKSLITNFGILSGAFGALSSIVALVGPLSASIGCGSRVLYLKQQLTKLGQNSAENRISAVTSLHSLPHANEGAVVQLSNVCVRVPQSDDELVTGLSLSVPGNALLMGPSGCGKSSVLRVIAGLWPAKGHKMAPEVGRGGLCFLTQRPYMCPGSLRQNIAYPSQDHISDSDVQRLLAMAGLSDLFNRTADFDEVLEWTNILSLGEQQRMAFARCFHMMPKVAILDESTSALDPENEDLLYQTLRSLKIHFVSVGHRSQLKAFHDQLIMFDGHGHFTLSSIQAVAVSVPEILGNRQAPDALPRGDEAIATKDDSLEMQSVAYLPLLRLCYFDRSSMKNLVLHLIILAVFGLASFLDIVWVKNTITNAFNFSGGANLVIEYFFIAVIAPAFVQTIVNALIAYSALRTRKTLCQGMHRTYFSGNTYYKMNTEVGGMSDAYSVIVNDCDKFTSLLPNVIWRPTNLSSLASASIGAQSIKPSSFGCAIVFSMITTYVVATGLQPGNIQSLWGGLGYLLIGVIVINIPTFKQMSGAMERRAKHEAAFKFVHSRIRLHAETIALYAAEDVEAREVERAFESVVSSCKQSIMWQSVFQGLQIAFQFVPSLVAVVISKSTIFNSSTEDAFVNANLAVQTATALYSINIAAFFYIGALNEALGHANRAAKLLHNAAAIARKPGDCDALTLKRNPKISRRRTSSRRESAGVKTCVAEFTEVTVKNPFNVTLIKDLSMQLLPGQGCLISGPSGCGKSSLLRVMGKLWTAAAGSVRIPQHVGPDGVFFLPQRPYMINSSLRDECTYPSCATASELAIGVVLDDRIGELLEIFGLAHLLDLYTFDTVNNWDDLLSLGEQQRVSLIRLVLHKPSLAILDECTSAIDETQQESFYRLLRSMKIAYISVGHRPELFHFHDTVLRMHGHGSSEYSVISQECRI